MQYIHGSYYFILTKLSLKKDQCFLRILTKKTKHKKTLYFLVITITSISEKQENGKTDTFIPYMSFSTATFKSKNDNPIELMKSQSPQTLKKFFERVTEIWTYI